MVLFDQRSRLFRLAGDEFTVLLEGLHDTGSAYVAAAKIIEAVSRPVAVDGGQARVGASIGLALFAPNDGASPEALIKEADERMYQAKRAGKGRICPPAP